MSQSEVTNHWYALRVKSRAEKKVNTELINKGIETFLPLQRKTPEME